MRMGMPRSSRLGSLGSFGPSRRLCAAPAQSGVGGQHVQHAASQAPGGLAGDPGQHAHQQVVGTQQQPAEDHAQREDVRPDAGEVPLQQRAARGAQVAARTDHRAGREPRHGHGHQRAHAHQRQQPAGESQQRLVDLAPGQQERIDHGQREQKVERPQPQRLEQHPADQRPRTAADVERLGLLGIDERAGRIARMVAQQRAGQEDGQRQEPQGEQVEFQVAVFEHRRVVNGGNDPSRTTPAAGRTGRVHARGQSFACLSQNRPFSPRPASVGRTADSFARPGMACRTVVPGITLAMRMPGRRPSRDARPPARPGEPLPSPRPEAPRHFDTSRPTALQSGLSRSRPVNLVSPVNPVHIEPRHANPIRGLPERRPEPCTRHNGDGRAAGAAAAGAHAATTRLAGHGDHRLPPLRRQHVHRSRVGRRDRGPQDLQSHEARRPAVGPRGQGGRRRHGDPHRQAPRRLLPLAQQVHRALGQEQPVARRPRATSSASWPTPAAPKASSSGSTSRPGTGTRRPTATRPSTTSITSTS